MVGKRSVIAILVASSLALCVIVSQGLMQKVSSEPSIKAISKVGEGLNTTVFQTPAGKISVNMPEDMSAGDTLTGTVVTEPEGKTPEEISQNQDEISGYVVEVKKAEAEDPTPPPVTAVKLPPPKKKKKDPPQITCSGPPKSFTPFTCGLPGLIPNIDITLGKGNGGPPICSMPIPIPQTPPPCTGCCSGPSSAPPPSGGCTPGGGCVLPTVGQCGHPVNIRCPGDGRTSDCGVKIGGQPATIMAASPRNVAAKSPGNVVGPTTIEVNKGGKVAKGTFNNLAVKLSCNKLVLKQGETTTVTVTVFGLRGLTKPVKLTLDNHTPDTVDMQGGNHQVIVINPTGADSQSQTSHYRY